MIGVLEDTAFFAPGVTTSRTTVDEIAGSPVPAQSYQFRLKDGVDPGAAAKDLEKAFAKNGLQAVAIEKEIEDGSTSQGLFNNLLMGFMGLGLLVGIAALGVIAARSVVERRQQIGMLRALGFQRGQVRLAFLIESSFVALLGIGLGVALGAALSVGIVDSFAEQISGIRYTVPWSYPRRDRRSSPTSPPCSPPSSQPARPRRSTLPKPCATSREADLREGPSSADPPFVPGTEHRCIRGRMRCVSCGTKLAGVMRTGASDDS